MDDETQDLGLEIIVASQRAARSLMYSGGAVNDVGLNRFGEMAMMIDVGSEGAVIHTLGRFAEKHNVGIQVVSEEYGSNITIGNNPAYTAFIDGLDGSTPFRDSHGKARCGTMFSLYKRLDPAFDDYIFGGIADHILREAVLAVKGQGTLLITEDGRMKVGASGVTTLDQSTRIYIDEGVQNYPAFPDHKSGYFYDPIKKGFRTSYLESSAVYFFDLAAGRADLVLEYGRKNNLEHMAAYPLVIESGGVMEYLGGQSIGKTTYGQYCQINHGYPAVIAAATHALADAVRAKVAAR